MLLMNGIEHGPKGHLTGNFYYVKLLHIHLNHIYKRQEGRRKSY